MKQFSLLRNYWDLLSIYRNLIYATGSTCFETNGCLFQRSERWRKLSAQFLCQFEQPEGKALLKSKFSHELGERKENIFTIAQMMTAYLWSWLWTVNHKKTRYSFNSILQGCFSNVRQIHVIQVRHVQDYWWFWEYFQWNKYHCFGSFVMMNF